MSQAVEIRLIELAKAFAQNRKDLLANAEAMSTIRLDQDDYVDMRPLRDRYWESDTRTQWHGWLHAVKTVYALDGETLDEDHVHYTMGVLLDERKAIKQRANALKTRLRAIGDQLLKEEKN